MVPDRAKPGTQVRQTEAGDGAGARAAIDHLFGTAWDARFGDVKAEAAKLRARLP